MPSSASAARVSSSRRFLKAGSTQARATTLAPSAGERLSMRSTWAAISCAVSTPFSISSERIGLLQHLVGAGRAGVVVLLRRRMRMRVAVIVSRGHDRRDRGHVIVHSRRALLT